MPVDDFIADDFIADDFEPDTTNPRAGVPQITPPVAFQGAKDFLGGLGASAAQLVFGGGDLLRRATGQERVMQRPEVQEAITPPPGFMGGAGNVVGDIAQFAIPGSKIPKAVKAVEALTAGTKLAKVAPFATKVAGEAAVGAGVEGLRTGGDTEAMKRAAMIGGGLAGTSPILGPLANLGKATLGKSTGAGKSAIETAATTASQRFKDAMRGGVTEQEIVKDLQDAVRVVRDNRSITYRDQLSKLPAVPVSKLPAGKAIASEMGNFRIKSSGSLHNLDFSNNAYLDGVTPAAKQDRALIQDAVDKITLWSDQTPAGMDNLKQALYEYSREASPRTAPFFVRLGDSIRSELESTVPGYKEMTGDYNKASDFLNNITSELSTNSKNDGTIIRKLATSLNQNNDYRRTLLEALDASAGTEVKEAIAGYALKEPLPKGLQGIAATSLPAMGAYLINPKVAGAAVFASPRAMGELMALISAAKRGTPQAIKSGIRPGVAGAVIGSLPPPPAKNRNDGLQK